MKLLVFPVCFLIVLTSPVFAQTADEPVEEIAEAEIAEKEVTAADSDGSLDDATNSDEITESEIAKEEAIAEDTDGSLDDASSSIDVRNVREGTSVNADVRIGYSQSEIDERDSTSRSEDVVRARWRLRTEVGIFPFLRVVGRVAGVCSSDECSPNLVLDNSIPTTSSIADGDITLDEAYFHWFRQERFDLAAGRMQTKFVARGGVFAKSLDRNDSNNVNVNWTDGVHTTFRARNGWVPHLILQYNSSNGASNVRRGPLDFSDSAARITYFFGIENLKRTPLFLQRGLDISYLPKSLLKDGVLSGRREDYYGVVVRSANRWPERDDGIRLRVAAEIGYAPETQTNAAAGLPGDGDTHGLAWNVVLSLMEFKPNHSIGVNYGETGAGWLLSPQFRNNESLAEIRYQWRKNKQLAFDFRIRKRRELEQLSVSDRKREEVDFFVRFTWGATIR
jgi:hypothetical protein